MSAELQAGRELDALIAEKVMGWVISGYSDHPSWDRIRVERLRNDGHGCSAPDKPRDYHTAAFNGEFPCYSTSIASAWEVVEKLKQNGVFANIGPDPSVGGGWNAQFYWVDALGWEDSLVDAEAPTAPHAICLAALKTMEAGAR